MQFAVSQSIDPTDPLKKQPYIRIPRPASWIIAFIVHEFLMFFAYSWPYPWPSLQYLLAEESFSSLAHFWFKWDSLWYLAIAKHGYARLPGVPALSGTVFFPWLPLLIHFLGVWPAWVATQATFAGTLWLADRFFQRLPMTSLQAGAATFLVAVNPAAIYYSTLYAEPWTLFFTLLSIEFGHRRKWGLAAFAGGLSALTQAIGVLVGLFPLVAFLAALKSKQWRQSLGPLTWGIGCFLGISSFALYLAVRFGNPLLFASSQHNLWYAAWSFPWHQWVKVTKFLSLQSSTTYWISWFTVMAFVFSAIRLWLLIGQREFKLKHALEFGRPDKFEFRRLELTAMILYTTIGLVVALSFGKTGAPLHSTIRIASVYFPLFAGIALFPSLPRLLLIGFFIFAAFHGAVLFTHGWWYL